MECFLILGSAPGEAEMLFDVINPSLNNSSDFVCIIPFFGATDCSRISTEIFFGINIDHTATSCSGTGIFTAALSVSPPDGFVIDPIHFGTDKFISDNSVFGFGGTFVFHGKRSIVWTAGNAIFIYCIIRIFKAGSYIKWNVCFLKMTFFAKSISGKKGFVKFHGIKCSVSQKCFGIDQRMFYEKVLQSWD